MMKPKIYSEAILGGET